MMSGITIETCPLCADALEAAKSTGWGPRKKVEGFCVELGYSRGGWGQRRNFVSPFSGEICPKCWAALEPLAQALAARIDALRDSRRIKVKIIKPKESPNAHP